MDTAEKAEKKEQEYKENTRIAVENAVKKATVEAKKKATLEAEKKEQEYMKNTRIASKNRIKKAAVPTALVHRLPSLTFNQLAYVSGRRRRTDMGEH